MLKQQNNRKLLNGMEMKYECFFNLLMACPPIDQVFDCDESQVANPELATEINSRKKIMKVTKIR